MIADRTQAEVQALQSVLTIALKTLEIYNSDSRNPALAPGVDTTLATCKTQLDLTVADVTP